MTDTPSTQAATPQSTTEATCHYCHGTELAPHDCHVCHGKGEKILSQNRGWEHLAIQLYSAPSKPSYAAVAAKLRVKHRFVDATEDQVRRILAGGQANENT